MAKKPAVEEGADVEEMLSTEDEAGTPEEPVNPPTPSEARVRCKAHFLVKEDRRRCFRDDTFMASEDWIAAHEDDLERL